MPVSVTETMHSLSNAWTPTRMDPPLGVNLIALCIKFDRTWKIPVLVEQRADRFAALVEHAVGSVAFLEKACVGGTPI